VARQVQCLLGQENIAMLKNKLTLIALAALTAASAGSAAADPDRRRVVRTHDGGWQHLAEVGTHRHDAEDYVSIQPRTRLDAVQLRARGGTVAIEGVRIKFTSGRTEFAEVNRRLRPGESVQIALPRGERVEQLILDYGNRGPYWRARETAHVQVLGLTADNRNPRDRDRFRDADRPWRDDRVRYDRDGYGRDGVEWRGGVQVQIR
jgi:hypothetical protein